jgi:hypothetical protein
MIAIGQNMPGSHGVAPAPERIVVPHIRPATPETPGLDVMRKQSAQPERIVAQMDHDAETALPGRFVEVGENIYQVAMRVIVVPGHPVRPVALPEFEQQGREVIGHLGLRHFGLKERVTHQDVEKQDLAWHQHGPDREQPLGKLRRVEQPVGALLLELPFQLLSAAAGATAQQQDHQVQVGGAQSSPRVRQNHDRRSPLMASAVLLSTLWYDGTLRQEPHDPTLAVREDECRT